MRQFGSETLRHYSDGCEVSGHFSTSAEVFKRHLGHKYRTVQPHGLNCLAIGPKRPTPWFEVSRLTLRYLKHVALAVFSNNNTVKSGFQPNVTHT